MRRLLVDVMKLDKNSTKVEKRKSGKLVLCNFEKFIDFNISHSFQLVIVGVSTNVILGQDVESKISFNSF